MSQVKETKLNGGLNGQSDNGAVLEAARKRMAVQKKTSLDFLEIKPKEAAARDVRLDAAEVANYINDIAEKGYNWIADVARPFLRGLAEQVKEVGNEILDDTCPDGTQLNIERQHDYETGIEFLLAFGPNQDDVIRNELEHFPLRRGMFEKLCRRVNDAARLACLADDLRYAESKTCLERLLLESKYDGKKVFVENEPGRIRAFGVDYEVVDGVFGHFNGLADEKLAEAISARSRELATAHKAEIKKQKQEVFAETDDSVFPDDLLFGDADQVNEKTALFAWTFQGHQNALKLRRSGSRLYIVSAIGKPNDALKKAQEELSEPFVSLNFILDTDEEHLCRGRLVNNKPRYDFGMVLRDKIFFLACWIRTAAGECLPNRLLPDDDTRTVCASNGRKPTVVQKTVLVDDEGKKFVSPEVFYFRTVNGGAGTITVDLPEGFVLSLNEVKNEQQEVIAPAREVKLEKPASVMIRRLIVDGKPKIVLDSCDDVVVLFELHTNGIPGVEWLETGRKGWVGLPSPLPGILSFRYKLACESGEIKPNVQH
ncbi:MAG: hypothetical protein AAB352_03140 [Patescibacteria group bacterium]